MDGAPVRAGRFGAVAAVAAAVVLSGLPAAAAAPAGAATVTGVAAAAGPVTVTGVVQEVIVDDRGHAAGGEESRTVLRAGDDVIPLTKGSLPRAGNGDTVRATLVPAGDGAHRVLSATTVAAAPARPGPASRAAAPDQAGRAAVGGPVAAAAETHNVYAVIVRPKGVAADSGLTSSAVTTAVGKAASYWSSQTGGAVTFKLTTIAPGYVSAYGCSAGNESMYAEGYMWDEALAKINIPDIPNQHLMIFAPRASYQAGCSYGLGSIGFWDGKPGLTFVTDTNQTVVAHELGHNLGLRHSNALHCGTVPDAAYNGEWPASCYAEEYGDLFDVMGYGGEDYGEGNLNAVHLDRMGHLPSAVRTINTTGSFTVRIAPLSASPTALRAVKIVEPTGQTYYVEYRVNSGRDTMTNRNPWHPSLGVRVLRQDPRYAESGSYVLDATPSWQAGYDTSLAVGKTLTSAGRRVTVTVSAADSTGATLIVTNGIRSVPARTVLYGLPSAATVRAAIVPAVKVVNAAGRPMVNWPVQLQRLVRGGTGYRTIGTVRTNVNGVASLKVTHSAGAYYRYVTVAGTSAPAKVSNVGYVVARAVATMRRPARTVTAGRRASVTGSISSVSAPVVYVQVRRPGGSWVNATRAKVSGTAVSGTVRLPKRGAYHVRLYLQADAGARYAGDCSPYYIVKAV